MSCHCTEIGPTAAPLEMAPAPFQARMGAMGEDWQPPALPAGGRDVPWGSPCRQLPGPWQRAGWDQGEASIETATGCCQPHAL